MLKKLMSLLIVAAFAFIPLECLAYSGDTCINVEHLDNGFDTKIDLVKVTPMGNVIQKENILMIAFAQNFNSKYYKEGDFVQFLFNQDLKTKEGTLLIPCSSSLIAKIECLQKPKWFSRNAKVYLSFSHILLPDGTKIPVSLKIAGKKDYLQKGAGATAAKIGAYTLAIGGFGTGLGAAIGVAGGNVITGLIIGGSVGGGVGLLTGIVSPGLHYKAKKGSVIPVELKDNVVLPK